MTRIKAFLIHLGISSVIFLGLLYLIIFIWYPQPYFAADGGWQGIRLVTGIDMILGPVLTLIVFKAGKPGLKYDLALIGILQALALSWGVWTVYDQRTALVVYAYDSYHSLNSDQAKAVGEPAAKIIAQADTRPPYAFVVLPTDKSKSRELRKLLSGGKPLFLRGDLYVPLTSDIKLKIVEKSMTTAALLSAAPENAKILDDFLQQHQQKAEAYAFLPLRCRYYNLTLVLDRTNGEIAGSLNIDMSDPF